MSVTIKKIRLRNYKRFREYSIEPNPGFNVLVGDNETGKSTILEAIDLVASGSVKRVESIGIDRLLNVTAVREFAEGNRTFDNLPKLIVELYLDGDFDHTMNGRNNTEGITCDGIRLICEANQDYQNEIRDLLTEENYFPYDYYSIRFSTFADEGYSGYKKKLRTTMIDSTNMDSEYATNDFVHRMYFQCTEDNIKERATHKCKYRLLKENFCKESLEPLNSRINPGEKYTFGLKATASAEFENALMIYDDGVDLDNKGIGRQMFIKTDFALKRSGENVDVVLIEEPENHLSSVNLRKLVHRIAAAKSGQIFITTHNSLISTRLELKNLLIMHEQAEKSPTSLSQLDSETAKYFQKAPTAGILEFVTANKVILVEGPSEYMLFERFYKTIRGCKPEDDNVHIINVHNLSFKRYLKVARCLGSKVAVVTDNDKNKQKNCIEKYEDFEKDSNIKICYDEDDDNKCTFEIVLYDDNKKLCDKLFKKNALKYMLGNKTEAAYKLLDQSEEICVPEYIKKAIEWISE